MIVSVILYILQISTMVAWGEGNLKKTPEGEKFLARVSWAGLFFLKWRACADYKGELRGLGRAVGWLALASVAVFYIMPDSAKPIISVYSVSFMGLWLSLRFGSDVKRQFLDMLGLAAFCFCTPLILWLTDCLHVVPGSMLHTAASPFRMFIGDGLADYQLALMLAAIGGLAGLLMAIGNAVFFSIIPLVLLLLMIITSCASRFFLGWTKNKARNWVSVYVILIGPGLIMLHALKLI